MLLFLFLNNKYLWILAWVLQSIGYYFVLRKLGDIPSYSIIPFFAEWRLSRMVFKRGRSFYRPFIIVLILILAGVYLNPLKGLGRLLIYGAAVIYFVFLARLYWRLCKAFHKPIWFYLLMLLFPPLFLFLLGRSTTSFEGPTFKIGKPSTRFLRVAQNALAILFSVIEVVVIAGALAFFTVQKMPPRIIRNLAIKDSEKLIANVTTSDTIITREDMLKENASIVSSAPHSRDYFFKDHSQDQNVVVLEYIIGSNLENGLGLASVNIDQMIESTKKGEHLSYVIQTGGSMRWFTSGIEEAAVGRYLIKDGNLKSVQRLDSTLTMNTPDALLDFLNFAKENYPADRYILVLWDHGGGFVSGFGHDDLNKRQDVSTMSVHEITDALKQSGMKFDVIGFDACLMQTIETALALEPYADYYVASEETEGGFGWFYTEAFGKLAQNPNTPTLDFAKDLITSYDELNTALKKGETDTGATLSVVDLTMIKPVYQEFEKLLGRFNQLIKEDSEYYADISLSASKAYTFTGKQQIDIVNFLQILESIDYENKVCADNACLAVADSIMATIPYRNYDSAEGINGMALTFPYNSFYSYDDAYKQYKQFDMNTQMEFFNNFFSIMAAQQVKSGQISSFGTSPTELEWYVKGYENYETTNPFMDIPLNETENGYLIELPDKIKKLITNIEIAVYQKDGERLRYLGRDVIGYDNEKGETVIGMDRYWVHINNHLVCYLTGQSRTTENGTIFTGTTKALLNRKDQVILQIEWEPTTGNNSIGLKGKVLGYTYADEWKSFMSKGLNSLQAGDRLQFIFDEYDHEYNLIESKPSNDTLIITNVDRIVVEDLPLKNCDIIFNGILTDVYQREMTTEQIEYHVE